MGSCSGRAGRRGVVTFVFPPVPGSLPLCRRQCPLPALGRLGIFDKPRHPVGVEFVADIVISNLESAESVVVFVRLEGAHGDFLSKEQRG